MKRPLYVFTQMIAPKIVLLTGLLFLGLLPFAGALEIHHVFAEVDHDGHDHHDLDLCQWVQQHANGLLVHEKPLPDIYQLDISQDKVWTNQAVVSFLGMSILSPRPPPFS